MENDRSGTSGAAAQSHIRQAVSVVDRPLPPRPSPSHNSSSEQRRRHTMLEQSRYPHSIPTNRHHPLYSPRSDDLASRILPQFRPRQSSPTMSDLVPHMPQWQPDEEVHKCPVCEQEFTLFFRKHHCRKCGKVVCGDCSRHRITVPTRYVAQPPWAADTLLQDTTTATPVRVCNPCVPDPWSPPDDQPRLHVPPIEGRQRQNRYSLPPPPSGQLGIHRQSSSLSQPPTYNAQAHPQQIGPASYRRPLPHPTQAGAASASFDSRLRFSAAPNQPLSRPPLRKEVKEEDECPVCGRELPPGDAIREEHIAECVTTRFTGDTARASPTTPAAAALEGSSSSPLSGSRGRAQSYRSRGLYQYTATEKDCVDGDGQELECPICFEEFQPGENLGRLECLCRFHHACIREWWSRRGPGMCPVHASHE